MISGPAQVLSVLFFLPWFGGGDCGSAGSAPTPPAFETCFLVLSVTFSRLPCSWDFARAKDPLLRCTRVRLLFGTDPFCCHGSQRSLQEPLAMAAASQAVIFFFFLFENNP